MKENRDSLMTNVVTGIRSSEEHQQEKVPPHQAPCANAACLEVQTGEKRYLYFILYSLRILWFINTYYHEKLHFSCIRPLVSKQKRLKKRR